jgi:regulator of protease activity HflC (stomatin/prohibitin superfamily)
MKQMRSEPNPPPVPYSGPPGVPAAAATFAFGLAVALGGLIFWWYFCRIEPRPGEIAILIRKTGQNLPPGEILATSPKQKGIQLDVLAEGRYFRDPYNWGWEIGRITDIPAGKLGVLTRLFGEDLPPGRIIATETSKGILKEVMEPGKYRINPYAYTMNIFDAITIRPGHVGVVTSLEGHDVINSELAPEAWNAFLVGEDLKGVLARTLDPGTYYLNPYLFAVAEVNLQSQRFELSGEDAITFLTQDGFTVTVEGTIEYALRRDKVAQLTHQVGDMDDILKKIILPRARGFSRIEGSKNPAKNYIMGDTRQKFQDSLQTHLNRQGTEWGIDIKSVLIRNITPPDAVASIIRDREVAVQDARKYGQQTEQAKSKAELVKQEMLAQQNKEKVEAETAQLRAVIQAQQDMAVRLTDAHRELEVATIDNQAASSQVEAILSRARADQEVIRLNNEAEAAVIEGKVTAFGSGTAYARNVFYERIAPRIESVLSGDGPGSVGGAMSTFVPSRKEVEK